MNGLPPIDTIGGDGFDPDGCAACGGTLLIKASQSEQKAWLRCAGCGREMRLGPLFQDVVRRATGAADFVIAPLSEVPS